MNYFIEVFCDNDLNANTYLIYNKTSCFIIDPANNVKVLRRYIEKRKVLGILLTHGHYDHFKMLETLLREYPCSIYMHKNAYAKLLNPETSYATMFGYPHPTNIPEEQLRFVKDGDKLQLETFLIHCWYTPGHTDCMMSYILEENLFSGDFLFKGSIGRTDLATSNKAKMFDSVMAIKKRNTNYRIYPGHEESTTLEQEKKHNIYLSEQNMNLIFD